MSKLPLVSAIIPVYNQAAFVEKAVQSILGQSYGNIELILIDDASTDGSNKVLQNFAGLNRVRVFRNSVNLECARTFNRGIELSDGDYFGILAADDTWEPGFVTAAVEALESHPEAAFCYCRLNLMQRDGRKTPRRRDRIPHPSDFYGFEFENIVRNLNPIPHHATLVRKKCVLELGGYDPELTTTHDWDLWLRLSRRWPVVFIDAHLANYRVHEANVSRQRSRSGDKERLIVALLDRLFQEKDLPAGLRGEKEAIYARAYLDIAEGYRVIADYPRMRRAWLKAIRLSHDPRLLLQYRHVLLSLLAR
ncbi:glycosyltransferase [bacterium]|nr:glycosyltransferase [bacterium]